MDRVISLSNNSAQLISRDKLEVQCRYCFQTETQTGPAGPLTFKAGEPERMQEVCLCLCLLLLFDYWAKLFNQVWNHKKAALLHCPGTEPVLTEGCVFCYQGTGGSAQLCKSPVAWSPAALLLCTLYTVFGVSRATCLANQKMERRGPRAQWRRRLFASLEHLESLWFMWEILEAGDRANVVTVPKPTLRKCSWLGKCVCVFAGSQRNYKVEHKTW